jgi:hypothetical protein
VQLRIERLAVGVDLDDTRLLQGGEEELERQLDALLDRPDLCAFSTSRAARRLTFSISAWARST